MDTLRPRTATVADAEAINAIYNHYVRTSAATFQVEEETKEEREEELRSRPNELPLIVLEADGEVVGWGTLSPFKSRCAYRDTIEISIYVRHDCHGRGIGSMLLNDLISRAHTIGHHSIVALISADQERSVALHHKAGFTEVGRLREVGHAAGCGGGE